jgi:hypothetical protein
MRVIRIEQEPFQFVDGSCFCVSEMLVLRQNQMIESHNAHDSRVLDLRSDILGVVRGFEGDHMI